MLGWKTVCAVEWEPYPASILAARQNDKILAPFPIWDDVRTFDGKPWRGIVDVVSGGFPCQDISTAGNGAGISGTRSGLWSEMARIIGEVRPRYAFVENSPMLTSRGLGTVLGDLAALGFDARWGVVSAADVGAPHLRERIWIVAHANGLGRKQAGLHITRNLSEDGEKTGNWVSNGGAAFSNGNGESQSTGAIHAEPVCKSDMADADAQRLQGNAGSRGARTKGKSDGHFAKYDWWESEPNVGRVANGVAARVDRLKAIGNGQVPRVAATAFKLMEAI